MGLFVINTVAPGGEEHRIPDYMLNKSYQMLEKFIRTAYGKPSEDYELHIHYESKCTKSDDVPPASFNIFIELDTLFSESNPRLEYYVCFIPKTDNPTPHLPKTPVSLSQSIERDVGRSMATIDSYREQSSHHASEVGTSSYIRRTATAAVVSQGSRSHAPAHHPHTGQGPSRPSLGASAFDQSRPTASRPLQYAQTTKRLTESQASANSRNKRARTIAADLPSSTARESIGSNNLRSMLPRPGLPSLEHTPKQLPGASIIPVPDGAPGSDVNNPIMIQPEDLDPVMAEKAYKFFLAHQLPVPYQRRFEVGVINKRKVPEKWNLDKNAQMNKVTVQLDNGCQVSHYCMNKDENDRPLTTPTNSKIRLDMVNYWPGIQMMYDKERLRIFLSRYNDSLKNGVPFEDAQPVIANLKRRVNNKATNASNVTDANIAANAANADLSEDVAPSNPHHTFGSASCTKCQKAGMICEPWDWDGYKGCRRCRTLQQICSLAVVDGREVRAVKAQVHYYNGKDGIEEATAVSQNNRIADETDHETTIQAHPPQRHLALQMEITQQNTQNNTQQNPQLNSQQTHTIDRIEPEPSEAPVGHPFPDGAELSLQRTSSGEREHRELYSMSSQPSPLPDQTSGAESQEQGHRPGPIETSGATEQQRQQQSVLGNGRQISMDPNIVRLSIDFRDSIGALHGSRPLNFTISIPGRVDWTARDLVDLLLRERVRNQINNTPSEEEPTSKHLADLLDAHMQVFLVQPESCLRLLFNTKDVDRLGSLWLAGLDDIGDEPIALVVSVYKDNPFQGDSSSEGEAV